MGRYMRNLEAPHLPYGTIGVGSNNLDTMQVVFDRPGKNWMLSATGILDPATAIEVSVGSASNTIDVYTESPAFRRSAAGLTDFPLLYPQAVQDDYIPSLYSNGGRVGPSAGFIGTEYGPFRNENTTYDALANLNRIWGSHSAKFGVYFQHGYKAQSAFSSHNSAISFIDDSANPYDTGFGYANAAIGAFNTCSTPRTTGRPAPAP